MEYSKAKFRKNILKNRAQLVSADLLNTASNIATQVKTNTFLSGYFSQAQKVLSYADFNGEVPTEPLLKNSTAITFLPKITDYEECLMAFYPASQPQMKNRYGIIEPSGDSSTTTINDFDIVLVPLVAFDLSGNRLGMGGGFYDRALLPLKKLSKRPLLIGLAHPFQEIKSIAPDSWDQPLDVILTGEKIIDPARILKPV